MDKIDMLDEYRKSYYSNRPVLDQFFKTEYAKTPITVSVDEFSQYADGLEIKTSKRDCSNEREWVFQVIKDLSGFYPTELMCPVSVNEESDPEYTWWTVKYKVS
jgi:hypothetical protein